jgi:hypothetical protein
LAATSPLGSCAAEHQQRDSLVSGLVITSVHPRYSLTSSPHHIILYCQLASSLTFDPHPQQASSILDARNTRNPHRRTTPAATASQPLDKPSHLELQTSPRLAHAIMHRITIALIIQYTFYLASHGRECPSSKLRACLKATKYLREEGIRIVNSTNKHNHITHNALEQILHLDGFFGAGLGFFE